MFLIITIEEGELWAQKLCFFPNTGMNLKPVKLSPYKFIQSALLNILISKETDID